MREILLIARRDFQAYFNTAWGYVILAIVLLINGLLFNAFAMKSTARFSTDVLEDFFYFASGTTMIAAIILSQRLFAEERAGGTMVLLDTAPVRDLQIVLGKFLAGLGMVAALLALTIYMPAFIFVNGKVSWGHMGAGYLGLLLLGAAVVAIGTWGSTLSRYQFVGAAVSGVVTVLLLLMWMLGRVSDPPIDGVVSYMSLFDKHFQPFMQGRVNTESVVFYLSLCFAFLLLSVRSIRGRRW
ncbi:MAG: ABC transporter permease [Pseudomonadota bacterium]